MAYRVGTPRSAEQEDLLKFVLEEFAKVEQNISVFDNITLKTLTDPPKRIFEGLTVLADGTSWNPGSGQGVYTYYASSWHKLG